MSVAAIAVAGVGLAGAAMSANAAKKAANTQAASADKATEIQDKQFQQTRADNLPFMQRGNAAGIQLNRLLGLPTGMGGPQMLTAGHDGTYAPSGGIPASRMGPNGPEPMLDNAAAPMNRDAVRAQLLSQYTHQSGGQPIYAGGGGENEGSGNLAGYAPAGSTVDEAGLNAAIDAQMAQHPAQAAPGVTPEQQAAADASDPQFGMLTREFTGANLTSDPGYQFGLNEGQRSLEQSRQATGGLYSGAAGKALVKFGADYGGTKFNEAFNRDNITKNRLYNQFAGVAGTGQIANSQVATAGANYANNAAENTMGAGNARASSYIAQGNTLQNALNGGVAAYMNRTPTFTTPPIIDDGYSNGTGGAYGGTRRGL